jgi:hypothetical protein
LNEIKVMYNGIKVDGTLYRSYLFPEHKDPRDSRSDIIGVQVSAKDYQGFPPAVHAAFSVNNQTDLITDYFDHDSFLIPKDHRLFSQAVSALRKDRVRALSRMQKRLARLHQHTAGHENLSRDIDGIHSLVKLLEKAVPPAVRRPASDRGRNHIER